MKKNPILQKKFEEGYKLGLEHGEAKGFLIGEQEGIEKTTAFIAERFDKLYSFPGIGEKTIEKFRECFGPQYFKKVEK